MNTPLISLIIPVHNAEKFLAECLESVLHQTYKNIEIVIVDDNSTDGSSKIIKAYKEKYASIRCLKVNNGNAAMTRRDGIKEAKADLVCFVDADDVIDRKYVTHLYKAMQTTGASISGCGMKTFTDKFQSEKSDNKVLPHKLASNADVFADHYHITETNKLVLQTLPCKLFKKELFNDIDYSVLITNIFEDNFIMAQVLKKVDTIGVIDEVLYGYRQADGSTSSHILSTKVEYEDKTLNFIEFFRDVVMPYCKKTLNGQNVDAAIDRLAAAEFFNYARMVPDLKVHNEYLEQKNKLSTEQLERRNTEVDNIVNSTSYKLGHAIVGPASKIVNTLRNRG